MGSSEVKIDIDVDLGNIFTHPTWVYISIPLGAALIGWATKILALKMMFYPLEFKGFKPFLGWQGQIPRMAPKVAATMVDTMMSDIIEPQELFDQLDPDELVKELGEPLRAATTEIVDAIMMSLQPQLWRALPDQVKDIIVLGVEARMPAASREMFDQFKDQLDQFFDVKHMVVTKMVTDKARLVKVFEDMGGTAFKFFVKAGLIFGFLIGLIQAISFGLTGWAWTLPAFGLLTGGLTDYLALQMIFRPIDRRTVFPGFKWQGVFQASREEVIRNYAELMAREIFTPQAILESLLTGPMSDRFFDAIQTEIHQTIDKQMGFAARIISAVGGRQYRDMKQQIADIVIRKLPENMGYVEKYFAERINLEQIMVDKMSQMDSRQFENLLRPIFKDDEWIIIVVGAALGFLVGLAQEEIILTLIGR